MTGAPRPIVLATGGTGGHVFPAQALAMELCDRGYRLVLVADRRSEAFDGALGELEIHRIDAAGISGKGHMTKAVAVIRLARGYFQARRLLKRLKPTVVVGFGSYPSAPTVLAAQHIGGKTVIHEQNAVLGRANRMLARRATRIATAFQTIRALQAAYHDKTVWTGNPVRPEVIAMRDRPYTPPSFTGDVYLLVIGGSQGAKILGEVVPRAVALLDVELRSRLRVVQQCRAEEIDTAKSNFGCAHVEAEVSTFFNDISERLAKATLVVCRSGASTVAELMAMGRPALLVPFAHATDDHQTANAEGLCDAGGGWIIQEDALTAEHLAGRLSSLLTPGLTLSMAAKCAAQMGKPEATVQLADLVVSILGGDGNGNLADRQEVAV
jgi:UDP-N-acetylglucosamine--N-acetylmuramyl-(pentapeptide) pyrophosphoryl-undecaprenol N-acetylglucosamine transferase